ncbi:MAG TPA: carboxypeptidase-like regulatory domain-containing protein [Bryobacteraceae bacterium]|nr:carboxypeptidase-like regulatory domain-containing protein [Bryobacteraceae bacterium]
MIAILPEAQAAKKKTEPESYALISGTVFRDPGFALPNATVTLTPDPSPGSSAAKIKKQQTVCNSRGEYVFRLPPLTMHYTVRAAAKGYNDQEKSIDVEGEARVDVTFSLQSQSK